MCGKDHSGFVGQQYDIGGFYPFESETAYLGFNDEMTQILWDQLVSRMKSEYPEYWKFLSPETKQTFKNAFEASPTATASMWVAHAKRWKENANTWNGETSMGGDAESALSEGMTDQELAEEAGLDPVGTNESYTHPWDSQWSPENPSAPQAGASLQGVTDGFMKTTTGKVIVFGGLGLLGIAIAVSMFSKKKG